ncbi:hypothetical protein [Streptomyces diastatochromogenes]|uniref:hypothetical protein n=1 Tax=Streptomyces diastatochromogenes TaxID=42236 RepID=UPI0036A3538C
MATGFSDAPLVPVVAVGVPVGDGGAAGLPVVSPAEVDGAALGAAEDPLAGQVIASSGQSGAAARSDPEQAAPTTASKAASKTHASEFRLKRRDIRLTSCPVG